MKRREILKITKYLYIIILLALVSSNSTFAQEKNNDITIGKTLTIYSEVLGENRDIFISTPRGYDRSQEKYPVLYVLDGGRNFEFATAIVTFLSNNNRIPRMIVIGIPNTERTRDFTPTYVARRPNSGGAEKFLKFMNSELFPLIEKKFRTHPNRILCGHSLCGMFSIYTLFTYPEMFNSHIAISPYLMYDNEVVVKKVESFLKKKAVLNKYLYITLGNEPAYTKTLNKLKALLNDKTQGLEWDYSVRKNEDHGTVPLKSLYDGLEFIYSDWQITDKIADKGLKAIKKHFKKLSAKHGYKIDIPEVLVNAQGYRFMGDGKIEKAIGFFKYNVELYPNSANVYDSLGEGLENNNQLELAAENYKLAVENGKKNSDPNIAIFKQNYERVKNKLTN